MATKPKARPAPRKPVSAKKLSRAASQAKATPRAAEHTPAPVEQLPIPGTEAPVPGAIAAREATMAEPLTMEFRSAAEVQIAILALTDRATLLEKLAKTNRAAGYPREALVQEQDRQVIARRLLAQLQPQAMLPLDEAVDVTAICTQIIGTRTRTSIRQQLINEAVTELTNRGVPNARIEAEERVQATLDEFETVIGKIAEHSGAAVVPLLDQLFQDAFTKGRLIYSATPAALLQELAHTLLDATDSRASAA